MVSPGIYYPVINAKMEKNKYNNQKCKGFAIFNTEWTKMAIKVQNDASYETEGFLNRNEAFYPLVGDVVMVISTESGIKLGFKNLSEVVPDQVFKLER